MTSPKMQKLRFCCTNENDVTCVPATQFLMNERPDQTHIETTFTNDV